MELPRNEADLIFETPKQALPPLGWSHSEKTGRDQSSLECRIALSGQSIPRGVSLRLIAYPTHLTAFTYQLECNRENARSNITLYRLETKPFRPHTNKFFGPEELRGQYFPAGESHEHVYLDSLTSKGDLRSNACAQARKVSLDNDDFGTGLELFCDKISLTNMSDIPHPPAQGALF